MNAHTEERSYGKFKLLVTMDSRGGTVLHVDVVGYNLRFGSLTVAKQWADKQEEIESLPLPEEEPRQRRGVRL